MRETVNSKSYIRWGIFSVIFLLFLIVFYFTLESFFFDHLKIPSALFIPSAAGTPVRLKIPSVQIDAPIEPLGLTANGAMDAPKGPEGTGWFEFGPRPGEKGSSVIDGHRGWRNNIPAAFDNLHKLRPGDKVYVTDNKGKELVFIVREMRTYDAKDTVPEIWKRNDGTYLNLITCAGDWNSITRTSTERLVVFTDLIT